MGSALENLFAFLLRDAAQHSKLFSFGLQFLEIGQSMEDLLLGLVADRTGVVENQIRLVNGLDLLVAFLDERADDLFRVVDIHLTAKSLKIKGLLRNPRHEASITRRGGEERLAQRLSGALRLTAGALEFVQTVAESLNELG